MIDFRKSVVRLKDAEVKEFNFPVEGTKNFLKRKKQGCIRNIELFSQIVFRLFLPLNSRFFY